MYTSESRKYSCKLFTCRQECEGERESILSARQKKNEKSKNDKKKIVKKTKLKMKIKKKRERERERERDNPLWGA